VIELDLGGAITGDGTYSFALRSGSTDAAIFSSKEGSSPPQLVVTTDSVRPAPATWRFEDVTALTGLGMLSTA
jgi:hypothetical protein